MCSLLCCYVIIGVNTSSLKMILWVTIVGGGRLELKIMGGGGIGGQNMSEVGDWHLCAPHPTVMLAAPFRCTQFPYYSSKHYVIKIHVYLDFTGI